MCGISTIWRKMCGISFFLHLGRCLYGCRLNFFINLNVLGFDLEVLGLKKRVLGFEKRVLGFEKNGTPLKQKKRNP